MGGCMNKTGAWLTVYALEQLPVTHTFGIPGMQNTEIYDELSTSKKIKPVLVCHESGASFMADAVSRTTDTVGTILVVPGAGLSNAMSGIAEAYLDGIPMIVISGGARLDTGKSYQLHQVDQHKLVGGAVKKSWHIKHHSEIVPAIFEAYNTAISGEPGPVYIEIPVEIQMCTANIDSLPQYSPPPVLPAPAEKSIRDIIECIQSSHNIGIFAGWGCRDASAELIELAELLQAPVSTTMQGYGVFAGTHPLHTGMSFGVSAVPAAKNAFAGIDCLIAIGTKFSEVGTASYGITVPDNLIHLDINPDVFNKNYPAKIALAGDAKTVIARINAEIKNAGYAAKPNLPLIEKIKADKLAYQKEWGSFKTDGVNPSLFFKSAERNNSR